MRGVDLTWPGGEHSFQLTIDLLYALQDKCDAGPMHILERLRSGQWRIDDVMETIRFGLEGGGMEKEQARKLVRRLFQDRSLLEFVLTAQLILANALYPREEDMPGEGQAGETSQSGTLSRVENGDFPASINGDL